MQPTRRQPTCRGDAGPGFISSDHRWASTWVPGDQAARLQAGLDSGERPWPAGAGRPEEEQRRQLSACPVSALPCAHSRIHSPVCVPPCPLSRAPASTLPHTRSRILSPTRTLPRPRCGEREPTGGPRGRSPGRSWQVTIKEVFPGTEAPERRCRASRNGRGGAGRPPGRAAPLGGHGPAYLDGWGCGTPWASESWGAFPGPRVSEDPRSEGGSGGGAGTGGASLGVSTCPESGQRQAPRDCSPPGSCVHGIFQARWLERVAVSFSNDVHVHAKSLQSSLPLCNLMDRSPSRFSVHEGLQARTLEWGLFLLHQWCICRTY